MRLLFSVLFFALIASSALAQNHPGWSRAKLTSMAAKLLGVDALEVEPVPDLPQNLFLLDPSESNSCFNGPDETIEAFRAGDFSTILLIGNEDRIHTLWAYFPILGVRDTDTAFAFYADFLAYLFPNWPQGESWAMDSLTTAWGASSRAYQDPMISYNEMIARQTVDGATLATAGVPPDIVTYRITSQSQCEVVSDYLLAKPRRAERDPAKRDLSREMTGLQLHYTKSVPTDVSSTPIFLGAVRGFRTIKSTEEVIRLSAPGPFAGTVVDLKDWLERQVTPPIANDTWSAIDEGWGYEHNFLFSITKPAHSISVTDEEILLLLDMASGTVQKTPKGNYGLLWGEFSGLLFGTQMTPWHDDRSLEPPYSVVGKGQIMFQNEGTPVPVDIQATPIHHGILRQYLGAKEVEVPEPYHAQIDGFTLVIGDATSETSLDLATWFSAQKGEPLTPERPRPISHPAIPFELDGRPHLLVISNVNFLAQNGEPESVQWLVGQVFSTP